MWMLRACLQGLDGCVLCSRLSDVGHQVLSVEAYDQHDSSVKYISCLDGWAQRLFCYGAVRASYQVLW